MATLETCPKHNMVAYLEKTDGNAKFHEIIDFLTRSSIYYALTVIAGKPVSISKASIRSDLQFNDAAGIDVLSNQAKFDTIQLMGMKVQFQKDHLKPQPTPSSSHPSEDPIEPEPDPSLRPSSSNPILDSIPEGSGGNHGGQSSIDRSLSGNEDGLTL
ncbi:hypothetical protein Tco_1463791 [Tanacetum coccineum]